MSWVGPRFDRGASLLDAVGATALLAVALLGLSAGPIALARNARVADGLAVATALAQERLERLRVLPLGSPGLAPGRYRDPERLRPDGGPGGAFRRRWAVSPPDEPSPGLQTVRVTVTWTDGHRHRIDLAAYVRCSATPCP